jgi:hypothetical protein
LFAQLSPAHSVDILTLRNGEPLQNAIIHTSKRDDKALRVTGSAGFGT